MCGVDEKEVVTDIGGSVLRWRCASVESPGMKFCIFVVEE